MADVNPGVLVNRAVDRGELRELLLGIDRYRYLPKCSPSPWPTDLTELLAVLYDRWELADKTRAKLELERAIYSLVDQYDGIIPVASCLLFESSRKGRNNSPIGLPLADIAGKLKAAIDLNLARLQSDQTGPGKDYPDGLLGELRRLSSNSESLGGPDFCS